MNSAIFVARFSLAESDSAATTFAHDHVITYITNRGRMASDFSGNSVIILYTIFSYLPQNFEWDYKMSSLTATELQRTRYMVSGRFN